MIAGSRLPSSRGQEIEQRLAVVEKSIQSGGAATFVTMG
jgi:hypothetical protein